MFVSKKSEDFLLTNITIIIRTLRASLCLCCDYAATVLVNILQGNLFGTQMSTCTGTGPWWRHQIDTFSMLLALCEGNPSVTEGFPSQRSVTRSFDVFFDVRLNKRLKKKSRYRRFETPWRSLWRHCNGNPTNASLTMKHHWTIRQYNSHRFAKTYDITKRKQPQTKSCAYFMDILYTSWK